MKLISGDVTVSEEPSDRMTRLTAAMHEALEAHPEYDDSIRAIVLLRDGDDHGGMSTLNYDDPRDALIDLLAQTQALAQAGGIELDLLMIPNDMSELGDA
jgi:hypothetical protein